MAAEPVDIKSLKPFTATESPLSVLLGVDVSGSMRGEPFNETQKAISRFLDQLEKNVTIKTGMHGILITDNGLLCADDDNNKVLFEAETIICAAGQNLFGGLLNNFVIVHLK